MYEDSKLYSDYSTDHQVEASKFLQRTSHMMKWKGGEVVLDIGCGSGDVTHNILLPFLPEKISHLVGVDFSNEMIAFARKRYGRNSKLSFEIFDIADPNLDKLQSRREFHKIYSFFCLQWVRDLRQAANNIKNLLLPGGQALLLFVVRNGTYLVWDTIARHEDWCKYFTEVELPFNCYQYMDDPDRIIRSVMVDAGLEVNDCKLRFHEDVFTAKTETDEEKIEKLRTVDPLIRMVPPELKDGYMREVLAITKEKVSERGATDYNSVEICLTKP